MIFASLKPNKNRTFGSSSQEAIPFRDGHDSQTCFIVWTFLQMMGSFEFLVIKTYPFRNVCICPFSQKQIDPTSIPLAQASRIFEKSWCSSQRGSKDTGTDCLGHAHGTECRQNVTGNAQVSTWKWWPTKKEGEYRKFMEISKSAWFFLICWNSGPSIPWKSKTPRTNTLKVLILESDRNISLWYCGSQDFPCPIPSKWKWSSHFGKLNPS